MRIPVLRMLLRLVVVARVVLMGMAWIARRSPSRRRLYWITALGIAANALGQLDRQQQATAQRAVTRLQSPPKPEPATERAADDLTVIEGIGPKIAEALRQSGIDTLEKLANATEADLRTALASAGMRFAPSLPTWAQQADYAARGEWDTLKTYQDVLAAGQENS